MKIKLSVLIEHEREFISIKSIFFRAPSSFSFSFSRWRCAVKNAKHIIIETTNAKIREQAPVKWATNATRGPHIIIPDEKGHWLPFL